MLILTRKLGEKIAIGNDITIVISEISGTHVKIGIEAPRKVSIYREEILTRTIQQNKAASGIQRSQLEKVLQKQFKTASPSPWISALKAPLSQLDSPLKKGSPK